MVRSLVLRGGKTQLQVWTANSDTAMVHLDGCRFEGSSDTAIVCRIPVENKVLKAPYQVNWISQAVPKLTPVPAEPGRSEFWNSTLFDIENCDFSNCARVMDLSCDLAVIRNSRIATPKAQKGPVFLLMNQVYFRNVKGMGSGSKTDSPYWIDISATVENKALLYVDECEFDVKGADGWCLVKSNLKPGYISTAIRVADSRIRSAGCPEGGIVSLAAGTSPNLIAIRNVTDPSGCAVRAVSYGKPLSKDDFLNRLCYYQDRDRNLSFSFCVSGCSDNIDPELTPGADDFLNPPLPEKIAASAKVKPVEFSFDPDAVFVKRIDAGKYGVTGKGKDESAAVEAALAAAAKRLPRLWCSLPPTFRSDGHSPSRTISGCLHMAIPCFLRRKIFRDRFSAFRETAGMSGKASDLPAAQCRGDQSRAGRGIPFRFLPFHGSVLLPRFLRAPQKKEMKANSKSAQPFPRHHVRVRRRSDTERNRKELVHERRENA